MRTRGLVCLFHPSRTMHSLQLVTAVAVVPSVSSSSRSQLLPRTEVLPKRGWNLHHVSELVPRRLKTSTLMPHVEPTLHVGDRGPRGELMNGELPISGPRLQRGTLICWDWGVHAESYPMSCSPRLHPAHVSPSVLDKIRSIPFMFLKPCIPLVFLPSLHEKRLLFSSRL
jgi:hypothetical protein